MTDIIKIIKKNTDKDGNIDLRGTQITALPDNLTVGGGLDLRGTQITEKEKRKVKRLIDGTIKERYIYADGILFHRSGRKHKIGGIYGLSRKNQGTDTCNRRETVGALQNSKRGNRGYFIQTSERSRRGSVQRN